MFIDDHLYEFYRGKNPRNRAQKLSKSAALNEIYPLTGYKIFYLFDFGDHWIFQIKYPVFIKSSGENPEQYPDYEE